MATHGDALEWGVMVMSGIGGDTPKRGCFCIEAKSGCRGADGGRSAGMLQPLRLQGHRANPLGLTGGRGLGAGG